MLAGDHRGAAAALNLGLRSARHPLIAQVDQDVVVEAGWLERLTAAFTDPAVAAAQGHYVAARGASMWARIMALDLAQRYRRLPRHIDHVCTGNTLYRASALAEVGFFDEELGYAYDNDLSYRLGEAGYRLVLCHDARSVHFWREGALGYLRQQYGQGYGRLDLVARHRGRLAGDDVSGLAMMLHAQAMTLAVTGLAATPLLAAQSFESARQEPPPHSGYASGQRQPTGVLGELPEDHLGVEMGLREAPRTALGVDLQADVALGLVNALAARQWSEPWGRVVSYSAHNTWTSWPRWPWRRASS